MSAWINDGDLGYTSKKKTYDLRDYFAAKAMQAVGQDSRNRTDCGRTGINGFESKSQRYAL